MGFRPSPVGEHQTSDDGAAAAVDYRLARESTLASYRSGDLSRHDVCDAHPELIRAAREIGDATRDSCPVCVDEYLVHVTYVFGPRLPKFGRCISLRGELDRIRKRKGTFTAYVVEACPACAWNHLVRRYMLSDSTDQ